jgi:peptidylprolyl isomerase
MKKILASIGSVVIIILLSVSAGCTTPAAGNISPAGTPAATAIETRSGTPALPGNLQAATSFGNIFGAGGNGNLQAAIKGDTVSVYYTGTFENGTVFESNMNETMPVVFTLGNSSVIEGFEEAVTGMSLNQQKTVNIPAEKAYGVYNLSRIRTVTRTGPIANTSFVEGQTYYIHDRTTNAVSFVKVLNVTPITVTWDENDPLADLNFTFTIKLVNISRP